MLAHSLHLLVLDLVPLLLLFLLLALFALFTPHAVLVSDFELLKRGNLLLIEQPNSLGNVVEQA